MSLPAQPWPDRKIGQLYNRSKAMMERAWTEKPYNWRLMKRSDRIAKRSFDLWFQAKGIDPHAAAVGPDGRPIDGKGTRRPK